MLLPLPLLLLLAFVFDTFASEDPGIGSDERRCRLPALGPFFLGILVFLLFAFIIIIISASQQLGAVLCMTPFSESIRISVSATLTLNPIHSPETVRPDPGTCLPGLFKKLKLTILPGMAEWSGSLVQYKTWCQRGIRSKAPSHYTCLTVAMKRQMARFCHAIAGRSVGRSRYEPNPFCHVPFGAWYGRLGS